MGDSGFKHLLKNGGFQAFLWTQFLGAFNDNVYKIIVSMRAVHVAANTGSGSEYLSLAGAVFVLPFLLFSGYAGHLADAVSKRSVLIGVKIFEIFVMLLGLAAFFSTRIELMLVVLFLMALHSAIFSPAKYGLVPEMLPDAELSRANALLEMSTFMAIVLGTSIGTFLFTQWKHEPWNMGFVLVALAVIGFLTSLKIPRVQATTVKKPFQWNPFAEGITGTKHLLKDRPLWLAVLGISYFWFLGALFQMDLLLFGSEVLKVDDLRVGLMVTSLAIGIGAGSLLAGRLSGSKVELGLVPLGSLFLSVFCILLYMVKGSYALTVGALALLGVASGIFIVPLNAYLQQRAESGQKGRIIATNNIWNTIGLLLASGTLTLLHDKLHVSPDTLILAFGILTIFATAYIVTVVPEFLIRFMLWIVTHSLFRIRIVGQENVPARGAALLVANHVTHVDGLLVQACMQRFIRFMVWRAFVDVKLLNWFWKLSKTIPVSASRRDAVESIRHARKELQEGHVVCIFAEGAISRTGNLLPFKRGMDKIVEDLDVPVIPVHLDRLWGSIFSFERGRFLWKWPKRIPYPVTITFGEPIPASQATAHGVRQRIAEMGSDAVAHRKEKSDLLHVHFARKARQQWGSFAMADSTGRQLTYGETLIASLFVSKWLRKNRPADEMIGLLLPSSVGGALANIGVAFAGKVSVNLNFTAGRESMSSAAEQCNIRTVITSTAFLAKAKIDAPDGAVFIEDILGAMTTFDKLRGWITARLKPMRMFAAGATPDSTATIIFSSGSTGQPKGVMLSHYNVISNIEAIAQVFWINDRDRVVGVLPFFHSFGFTVTLWFPIVTGCGAVYHPNPMESKAIGDLVQKHKATLLLSTPTFCSGYTRKCTKEQFASLRFVLVGAEKLREPVAAAFRDAFGLELLEGYGCTEMSPVVAVNAPDYDAGRDTQTGTKPGTVGHPLPGVAVKVVDPETMTPLGPNVEGLLLVRGSNRMTGYLGQPQKTADVLRDGWYVTGDIAVIDDDGFVRITDRLSRFSKVGGEMVPHLKIEEAIYSVIGDYRCAVTGIPDDQRGERLVALYTHPSITPQELALKLGETDLPKLWLPKRDSIYQVDSLPTLGTGKLDLRGVKQMAVGQASACVTL